MPRSACLLTLLLKLERLGVSAVSALRASLANPDLEIRRNCVLLLRTERSDRERRFDAFLENEKAHRGKPLVDWEALVAGI